MSKKEELSYGSDYRFLPVTSIESGNCKQVLPDLLCMTIQIVNIVIIGNPHNNEPFILIDAGMPGSGNSIITAIEERFGNRRPEAIILTHGHFDHVGGIIDLVNYWNIPIYAHELELPYLTGIQAYPDFDSTVEGGLVAKLSPLFPNEPINLGDKILSLPTDGSIPALEGWKWLHTPGHSPGHISLFRESDRALIAGDAFVTVKQEYLYKVLTQEQEISGPPRYATTDWRAAWNSVMKLDALNPSVAITGHGYPMKGHVLTENLRKLAEEFNQIAIPKYGKYVH